jgi:glucan 1,3-beta-glucosidase
MGRSSCIGMSCELRARERSETGADQLTRVCSGGTWDSTPFSNKAMAQADTPSLSGRWDYSTMTISGVNLGGCVLSFLMSLRSNHLTSRSRRWLTLEPFITPALYEPFLNATVPAVDEWTLSENLGDRLAEVLEHHYATFIVRAARRSFRPGSDGLTHRRNETLPRLQVRA